MFPNNEKKISQMNHMKYISTTKPHEYFIIDKIQSSYVGCTSQNMKQPIHVKLHVQSNNVKHVKMNEHIHNSTYIDIYNKQIKIIPKIPCFCCERLFFKNNLNIPQLKCQNNFQYISKFKENLVQQHTYVQIVYLYNINENKSFHHFKY
jgi:hypothetical protein